MIDFRIIEDLLDKEIPWEIKLLNHLNLTKYLFVDEHACP